MNCITNAADKKTSEKESSSPLRIIYNSPPTFAIQFQLPTRALQFPFKRLPVCVHCTLQTIITIRRTTVPVQGKGESRQRHRISFPASGVLLLKPVLKLLSSPSGSLAGNQFQAKNSLPGQDLYSLNQERQLADLIPRQQNSDRIESSVSPTQQLNTITSVN